MSEMGRWQGLSLSCTLAVSVTTLSLLFAAPAFAAAYGFTFVEDPTPPPNSDDGYNYRTGETGSGSLSFSDSSITGVGVEDAYLSALTDASFDFSLTAVPNDFTSQFTTSDITSPVEFEFDNGVLDGVTFSATQSLFRDTLSVTGTSYIHLDANNTYYSGPLAGQKTIDDEGTLSFSVVTPLASVPEPASLTILLAGLGIIGAGKLYRRKSV